MQSPIIPLYFYRHSEKADIMKIIEKESSLSSSIPIYFGETDEFVVVTSPAFVNGGLFTPEARHALRPMWKVLRNLIPKREKTGVDVDDLAADTLTGVAGWAEDYHLVQTQVTYTPGAKVESLTIYVLDLPKHRTQSFNTFDSKDMEEAIGKLPRGSVLHYDGNALMKSPSQAQMQTLTSFCKKKGISFIVSPTN